MTPDERAQLIEDIRRSATKRERIVEQAGLNQQFDIAAAWEEVEQIDDSIQTRIVMSRKRRE